MCACSKEQARATKDDGPAKAAAQGVVADAMPIDAAVAARKVFLHGASRCGECHEKMFDEWTNSAHAKAATSELYKAASAQAKDPACVKCHTPLAADVPKDIINEEGVTCDVCHSLRDVKPTAAGAGFTLAIDDMVKYGPRCGLKDHYFHRMGCSPEHQTAEVCGGCHWWEPKGLPVFTEYADWKAGPSAAKGEPCQTCHMPTTKAALAVGAPVRDGVPDHGQLGAAGDLRKTALALSVTASDVGGQLEITTKLTNVGGGHPVPAGLPERRIAVRVVVRDAQGKSSGADSIMLGRELVDASGKEAPFWRAVKVGEDSRIAPGAEKVWTMHAPPPAGAGTIEVEVSYRPASEVMAAELKLRDVEEQALMKTEIPFGAPAGGKHANLPRTVQVAPAKAGDRAKKGKK